MALNSSRPATQLARQALRRCRNTQSTTASTLRPFLSSSTSSFSTATPRRQQQQEEDTFAPTASTEDLPRWAHTPERMKAPFATREPAKNPRNTIWQVNEDPQRLDDALNNFLGKGGERLLPEELKWLAVTHKSFDQGRRGFNDRLAFLGRQIAVVEALQSILTSAPEAGAAAAAVTTKAGPDGGSGIERDPFERRRQPFEDKALDAADRLSTTQPDSIFELKKLQKLAVDTGLSEVVRWKPRLVRILPVYDHIFLYGWARNETNILQ